MRMRTLLVVVVVLAVLAFVAINWAALAAPTTLSLAVTTFEAPIGLVMTGILGLVVLAFALYMVAWQSAILLESRRQAKELNAQRALADQAEASRFTELRSVMRDELARLGDRIAQTQEQLRGEIHDSANSLAATIAEMDDRLQGRGPGGAS